jgi:hypothetical protein
VRETTADRQKKACLAMGMARQAKIMVSMLESKQKIMSWPYQAKDG